ncbi:hypothetical protein GCM10009128_22370 [Psychrosphaera haliotis]|uniref:sulfur carrier protein ThiS n=1 Tax=Psychrosphaera haliotis TaxID=555083 RepID=UPI0031D894F8
MNIHINGHTLTLADKAYVSDALHLFLSSSQLKMSYAVALNGEFVSKSQYTLTSIKNSDSIDVLFPIHGG